MKILTHLRNLKGVDWLVHIKCSWIRHLRTNSSYWGYRPLKLSGSIFSFFKRATLLVMG